MSLLVMILGFYVLLGLVVGLAFVLRGVNRVDPVAGESSFVFRLVVLPGCVGALADRVVEVGPGWQRGWGVTHRQRKMHVVLWLLLGPVALLGLVLALAWRPAEPVQDGPLPGAVDASEASPTEAGGRP